MEEKKSSSRSIGIWGWTAVLIGLIGWWVWFSKAQEKNKQVASVADSPSVATSSGASVDVGPSGPIVDRMTDSPAKFIGSQVAIDGNVRSVPAARVFSILEPGSRHPLLIIATQSPPPLRPDDSIEARGRIVRMDGPALERQYGVDLSPERIGNWANKPVLIAERVILHHSTRAR